MREVNGGQAAVAVHEHDVARFTVNGVFVVFLNVCVNFGIVFRDRRTGVIKGRLFDAWCEEAVIVANTANPALFSGTAHRGFPSFRFELLVMVATVIIL